MGTGLEQLGLNKKFSASPDWMSQAQFAFMEQN